MKLIVYLGHNLNQIWAMGNLQIFETKKQKKKKEKKRTEGITIMEYEAVWKLKPSD